MKLTNSNGFSLTELIIVIVVVGILAIVATYAYQILLFKAVATEGKTLMGTIARAEKTYWVQYGHFYGYSGTEGEEQSSALSSEGDWSSRSYDAVLGIDARGNTYFNNFTFNSATTDGLVVTSKATKPYDLTLQLDIHEMNAQDGAKTTLQLFRWGHSTTAIDID